MSTSLLVAVDHPSLDGQVEAFLAELRGETRRFGPHAMHSPKPFPSLLRKLDTRSATRLAAIETGRIVGMVAVAPAGDVAVAVVADRRDNGIGRALIAAAMDRARASGHGRLRLATSQRSAAMTALAASHGWIAVDLGRGKVDLIIDLTQHVRSA
jgi:GNAT superfamily N-acetyltransferase